MNLNIDHAAQKVTTFYQPKQKYFTQYKMSQYLQRSAASLISIETHASSEPEWTQHTRTAGSNVSETDALNSWRAPSCSDVSRTREHTRTAGNNVSVPNALNNSRLTSIASLIQTQHANVLNRPTDDIPAFHKVHPRGKYRVTMDSTLILAYGR